MAQGHPGKAPECGDELAGGVRASVFNCLALVLQLFESLVMLADDICLIVLMVRSPPTPPKPLLSSRRAAKYIFARISMQV